LLQSASRLNFGVPVLVSQREIPQINNASDAKKSEDDIQSHLNAARALLDSDPDFINSE